MTALVSILFIVMGLKLFYKGIVTYFEIRSLQRDGTHTMATVVEVIKEENMGKNMGTVSYSHWPIYEYEDIYGNQIRYRPSSISFLEKYKVGDKVQILYHPNDGKDEVLVLTKVGFFKDILGYAIVGTASFVGGFWIFIHNDFHNYIF